MAPEQTFDPAVLTKAAEDALTVRRVFGEAYHHGDVTLIPVARVMGALGTGAGQGEAGTSTAWLGRLSRGARDEQAATGSAESPDTHGHGHGGGGAFGARLHPLGVYVVDAKGTRWVPAVDANLVLLGAALAFTVVASTTAIARAFRRG